MNRRPSDIALGAALDAGVVDEADTAVVLYDLATLRRQVDRIRDAFPASAHHAVAVKSNPLVCVLREMAEWGCHAEAASAEELAVASVAGFADRTVWDSPAKTRAEIDAAMTNPPGLTNVDSFDELARYPSGAIRLGLRINPEVAPATIASLATAVAGSKFGVPISERERIVRAVQSEPRLCCLHVHSGSNSRSLDPMVDGIRRVVALADEINAAEERRPIDTIDIGGGLPWTDDAADELSVERYAEALRAAVPQLFDGTYRIVTEFGRLYHLGAGATASRVEYVKASGDTDVAVVHVGADSFVREVYDRANWSLHVRTVDALDGDEEPGGDAGASGRLVDVVGPLCFEGDALERGRADLVPRPGGWIMIDRTGANTFSLWSHHCSRAFPKVLLYDGERPADSVRVGKRRQSPLDAIALWS